MQFTHKDNIIGMPETPFIIRVNKQSGCFAIGGIEVGNLESMQTYGRGKSLEFALVKCDSNLSGRVSKLNQQDEAHTFVSAIVIASDDKRIPKGLLIHFLVKGSEAQFFNILAMELETVLMFGGKPDPQVIKMIFDKKIQTKYNTVIQPPTMSVRSASKADIPIVNAAEIILADHPQYLPDATTLYATLVDEKTGEVVSGLNRMREINTIAPVPERMQLEASPEPLTEAELADMPY